MSYEKRFYRPDEVAALFRVSVRTVRRWISEKRIEHIRLGQSIRIPAGELERIARGGLEGQKPSISSER